MKNLTRTLSVTALAGLISATTLVPAASAAGPRPGQNIAPRIAGPVQLVCAENAQARIERGLERLENRLELTQTQSTALENFRTALLAAQADYSEVCARVKPVAGDETERPDLIDRLNARHTLMNAQVEAMGGLIPEFEKFFDSLTDEQKAQMRPRQRDGAHTHGPRGMGNGAHTHRMPNG